MPSNRDKIGIFDSGVGGLTVAREIFKKLPNENVVYFGDTGRFPYGTRSQEVIQAFSLQAAKFLSEQGIKFLVVACNTASAQALPFLKEKVSIPVLGVIEPGARAAVTASKNGRVGVIGTEATVSSQSYTKALQNLNAKIKVFSQACPLFVALAEEGYINKKASFLIAQDYLYPLKKYKIDTLILGCTHFPLLKPVIEKNMGKYVKLVDAAESVAKEVKAYIEKEGLARVEATTPERKFYVSDQPEKFAQLSSRFLKQKVSSVEKVDISRY